MSSLLDSFKATADQVKTYSTDNPAVVGAAAAAVSGVYLLSRYLTVSTTDEGRKGSFGLSLGKETNGDSAWNRFASSWSQGHKQAEGGTGAGNMHDPAQAAAVVNDFYSFVTDIYEWGWGASFHFAPKIWSHEWKAGEACQEVRIAHMLRATPGMKVLDVGCGVGGPMRIVAASTGAHVTGITISEYQVERCKKLNEKAGMSEVTEVIQGDFHKMPFADNSFDAIFTVEATCHASSFTCRIPVSGYFLLPTALGTSHGDRVATRFGDLLQPGVCVAAEVYSEIFRVLKPGGCFVSQEWVSTKLYDADNEEHVRIIEEINFGNSLPNMRTWSEAESAGKQVGFQLVTAYDAATILPGPNAPWFQRLTQFRHLHYVDDAIIKVLGTLRLIPRTLIDVHTMLVRVAKSLVQGGESGVFTPMYMMCFEKPQ